jgi:PAS domain S-box-containing protein
VLTVKLDMSVGSELVNMQMDNPSQQTFFRAIDELRRNAGRLWQALIYVPYQETQRRRQGELLAGASLFIVFAALLSIILPIPQAPRPFGEHYTAMLVLCSALFTFVYALNRAGKYTWAATLMLSFFTFSTIIAVLFSAEPERFFFLIYLLVPILLSTVLLSFLHAFFVYSLIIGSFAVMLIVQPDARLSLVSIMLFVMTVGLATLMMIHYRDTLEADRQRSLSESEARYRSLVEVCPDAIVVVAEGRFVFVNPAAVALFGAQSAAELLGKAAIAFIDPAFRRDVSESVLRPRDERPVEQPILRLDGTARTVEVIGSTIIYDGKRARQSVIRDITERQKAQQQALELALEREKIKLLEQFISDTSHDLRTPIATLNTNAYVFEKLAQKMSAQLSLNDVGSLERTLQQLMERAQDLRTTSRRLARIVEGMFDMARLDGLTTFTLSRTDLNAVVARALEPYFADAEQLGCTLTFMPYSQKLLVFLNEMEFGRVLQNLVENALQYTPRGGKIAVSTYPQENKAVFEVSDSGIGIAADELPHIFERFYRTDKARSTHTGGAGLGLAIAKKIVEGHRGRITVESAPDHGTTFRVYLPMMTAQEQSAIVE